MWRTFGVLFSLMRLSCASFALSLGMLAMCVVVFFNVHHGGLMYGCISSMFSAMYSGYCLTRCSRLDEKVLLFVVRQCLTASWRQTFVGCFAGSVWIRVRYLVTCLRSSSSIGSSSVSYCRATVEVVLKHPVIVFIAMRCTVVRLLICEVIGEFHVSSGLCHIGAPYCILGFMTAVYNLFAYLKGAPHVTLAILDSAKANLVPFFLACSMWAWNFSFLSKTTPRYCACPVGEMVVPFS